MQNDLELVDRDSGRSLITTPDNTGADLIPLPSLEQAREYIRASKAENTLRGLSERLEGFLRVV
jgi:hypothetical protein